MVVHDQFPAFRLATQLARQMSAPIATRIKEYARTHPRFARTVCMRLGRLYCAGELRFKMWSLRLRQPAAVRVTDADALNTGADILGESVIFGLGAAIITFEVNRQAVKQENKVLDEQSEWLAKLMALEELRQELELQQADIDRLAAALRAFAESLAPAPSPAPAPAPAPTTGAPPTKHDPELGRRVTPSSDGHTC